MIFDAITVVLLLGILAWTWTAAAYLRAMSGQLNQLIFEVQRSKVTGE